MTWDINIIPPDGLTTLWPVVAPMLSPAVKYSNGRIDMRSVFQWLQDGRYILWIVATEDRQVIAAMVTREARYPKKSALVVDLCGGSALGSWANDATRVLRSYARDAGIDSVEMFGRCGWSRALKPYGWSGDTVLLEINAAAVGGENF